MQVTRSKLTLQTQGYFQVAITSNEKLRKYSLSFSSLRAAVCFKYFQAHVFLILIFKILTNLLRAVNTAVLTLA